MNAKHNKSGSECSAGKKVKDVEQYPGISVNCADDNAVDPKLVKERTKTLNNNPRNSDL
ncbi:MAG: hypothetical protein K2L90_08495 [Muribaculaceae bacterium]|nr:hypothetical protein [Muribaculaceae bacterium]